MELVGAAAGASACRPVARMHRSRETGLLMGTIGYLSKSAFAIVAGAVAAGMALPAFAQDRLPWLRDAPPAERPYNNGGYNSGGVAQESLPPPEPAPSSAPRAGVPTYGAGYGSREESYRHPAPAEVYNNSQRPYAREDAYRPPTHGDAAYGGSRPYVRDDAYRPPARFDGPPPSPRDVDPYASRRLDEPEWRDDGRGERYRDRYAASQPPYYDREPPRRDDTFSMREIVDAGHGFFGSLSQGLASVIEYSFKTQGRPNGYILGEDLGGAFVAGLRYGEGRLFTRDAGSHKVFWQGPSLGYDAGAEGSKVMVLVYNLTDPADIYQRFGGVAGSAYVVGGVGLTFQKRDDIVLAPIRVGLGLRFGANIGYLKYTRRPTWNPF